MDFYVSDVYESRTVFANQPVRSQKFEVYMLCNSFPFYGARRRKKQVWGAVLVCPGGEMYHAGERHGRAYVWPRVRRGCQWLAMVCGAGDPIVGEAEAR